MAQKNKNLTIAIQAGLLKSMYPGCDVATAHDHKLSWHYKVSPSPLSNTYDVRLDYVSGKRPQVHVLTPLSLAKGKARLPHVYDTEKQRLCLYYPDEQEWNPTLPLAKTIVPWIYEWLYYYEFWLGSGDWLGGGVHPPANKIKIEGPGQPFKTN